MFVVEGYVDGVSYVVQVDADRPSSDVYKAASGSLRALQLIRGYDGTEIALTPVGPVIRADAGTGEGVLAILTEHTQVTSTVGDVPDLHGPEEPGTDH